MQLLSGLFGALSQTADILDIPSRLLGILGLLSTIGGYLTGRRSARGQSPEAIAAALLAQLGHPGAGAGAGAGTGTGASAALTPAAQGAQPQPNVLAPSPVPLAGAAPFAAGAVPIAGAAAGGAWAASALAKQTSAGHKGVWQFISYRWLAIVSLVGLGFSVIAWIFEIAVAADNSETALELLGLFGLITWAIGLATIIWGLVYAVRRRRWGWAISLVLFGIVGIGFLVPSAIAFLFALVGPTTRPGSASAPLPLPLAAYGFPQYYGQQPIPQRPLPYPSGPRQPMPYQAGPQQPITYPGMAQPPAVYPVGPQQPISYPGTAQPPATYPSFSPQPAPAQPNSQPSPPATHPPGAPIRQAGPMGDPQQPLQQPSPGPTGPPAAPPLPPYEPRQP